MTYRIGVLCHMLTRQDPYCTLLAWGVPKQKLLGRVPKAIEFAMNNHATCLVFSAGANHASAKPNSHHARNWTFEHMGQLADMLGRPEQEIREWLDAHLILEPTSLVTQNEINNVGKIFLEQKVTQPVQVSSPDHIPLAWKLGLQTWGKPEFKGLKRPWAVAADTEAPGQGPETVIVVNSGYNKYAEVKAIVTSK